MSVAFKSAVDDAVLDELRAITGDPNRPDRPEPIGPLRPDRPVRPDRPDPVGSFRPGREERDGGRVGDERVFAVIRHDPSASAVPAGLVG